MNLLMKWWEKCIGKTGEIVGNDILFWYVCGYDLSSEMVENILFWYVYGYDLSSLWLWFE